MQAHSQRRSAHPKPEDQGLKKSTIVAVFSALAALVLVFLGFVAGHFFADRKPSASSASARPGEASATAHIPATKQNNPAVPFNREPDANALVAQITASVKADFAQRPSASRGILINELQSLRDLPLGGVVTVSGYYAHADGAGGDFVRKEIGTGVSNGVDANHPGTVVALGDGTGWVRIFAREAGIHAAWFGARASITEDQVPFIQRAIDVALYSGLNATYWGVDHRCGSVTLPPGSLRTQDTIHVGYGHSQKTEAIFSELTLAGSQMWVHTHGTRIYACFDDRPALNVQGSRGVVIEDLAIDYGSNDESRRQALLIWPLQLSAFRALGSLKQTAFGCGISVDAYSNPPPEVGYPPVKYPGTHAQYNKGHSSIVTVRRCSIKYAPVGIATKVNGDGNSDFMLIDRCVIQYCFAGVMACHSQGRNTTVNNCQIVDCYHALTNSHLSDGTILGCGLAHTIISRDSAFDGCKYLVWFEPASWATQYVVENSYAERLGSIGRVFNGAAISNVYFRLANSNFTFFHDPNIEKTLDVNRIALRIVDNSFYFVTPEPNQQRIGFLGSAADCTGVFESNSVSAAVPNEAAIKSDRGLRARFKMAEKSSFFVLEPGKALVKSHRGVVR